MAARLHTRLRGWPALALGLVAFGVALAFALREERKPASHVTLTAGFQGTTRALVARALASEVSALGVETEVVDAEDTVAELERVDSGAIDFALVSGAFRIEGYPHVREVAPLYVEALHLLVKQELAGPVGASLAALRGRTIDLGGPGSTTEGLATAVLTFADVRPGDGTSANGYLARGLSERELAGLLEGGDRSRLPDAIFHLATVPSRIALRLVRGADYRLVPLPFAEAFRLTAIINEDPTQGPAAQIERPYTSDTIIPAFTYQIDAPVPAEDLHTVGTRLLLVAHEEVSPETVERVLHAAFSSRFARMHRELLDRSMLGLAPRLAMHPGAAAFLERNNPFTAAKVEEISNRLSVLGTLAGGGLFVWQGLRQRRRTRSDRRLTDFMLRVAERERRIVELELSSNIELEALISLQRDLLQLKSEALERFARGELGDHTLSNLLIPVNAARDHVGELLLHVRENLEQQAETQGRAAQDLWAEAAEKSDETS